jgi:hypothetical protein
MARILNRVDHQAEFKNSDCNHVHHYRWIKIKRLKITGSS